MLLFNSVIARLAPRDGVDEVTITDEDEYFPPPRNLRELIDAVDGLAGFGFGSVPETRPEANDRRLAASDVLATLG